MSLKFCNIVITVLLLLLSLYLFALVSYFVLLTCYSAIRLPIRKCGIKLSISVSVSVSVSQYLAKIRT